MDKFTYGEFDRSASLRIPVQTVDALYKGRIEDRRPAANACPYLVVSAIIKSCSKGTQNYKDFKTKVESM